MPRTATTGPAIYEHVTKLLAGGKTKTEAFAEVANERKSSPGTVAANYNRVAPAGRGTEAGCWWPSTTPGFQGGARYLCGAGPDAAMGRTSNDDDLASLARQVGDLTQELVRRVEERDRRIRELLG